MFIVPSTPKEGVKIEFTEAADGSGHLALERLPPHLAVGDDFQSDAFLQSDGVIDGAIFYQFEFSSGDGFQRRTAFEL